MLDVLRDVESDLLTPKTTQLLIIYCNLILEKDYTILSVEEKQELKKLVYGHFLNYCDSYFEGLQASNPTMARRWNFLKQANFDEDLLRDFDDTAQISEALAQNYLASLINHYNKKHNTN